MSAHLEIPKDQQINNYFSRKTKGPISMPDLEAVLLSVSTVMVKRLIGGESIILM